jgi:tripeptide aminopeptidase
VSQAADPRFSCALAEELAEDVLRRFLRYARIDTQGDVDSTTSPSTAKQLDLSRLLADELRALGLADVDLAAHGHLLATLPGTVVEAPTVALIAHVDTSTDAPGGPVTPIVHARWDGRPIVLPGDTSQVLDPSALPELDECVGHDLVTSDGTTLLGADDKAGVAAIMGAVAHLVGDDRPRAPVRLVFTVDEEIGRGTDHLDLALLDAAVGYTLDGSGRGELEVETFSAYKVTVSITGVGVHPGSAKGRMVNAVRLASDLVASLPRDRLSPETTEQREGYLHPLRIVGQPTRATAWFLVRDHDDDLLEEHLALLHGLVDELRAREPRATVDVRVEEQYRNMRRALDGRPDVVEAAVEAIRRVGLEPRFELIRGGTDGARLTALGLPTPNLFTGGRLYHSVREWVSVQDMAAASATAVELVRLWGERPAAVPTGG